MAQQLGGQPILILKEGSSRTRGRDAQGMNITAAKAVAGAVKPLQLSFTVIWVWS